MYRNGKNRKEKQNMILDNAQMNKSNLYDNILSLI